MKGDFMVRMKKPVTLILMVTFLLMLGMVFSVSTASADTEKAKEDFNKALNFEKDGNTDAAILSYQSCISGDPNFVDAYINLGAIYFAKRDYEKALSMYKTATEKDNKNVDAFANLGRVEYTLKKYLEAETAFKSALSLKEDPELYKELGKVYYKKKNYDDVISTFNKYHAAGKGDYLTYYMLGKAYQLKDNNTEAINALKQSINLKSDYYSAHSTIGQIYLSQEKYSSAAGAFKAAMDADPKNYRAAYNYAVAVESSNPENYSSNINNWEKFIKIAKSNPKAKRDLTVAQQHVKELKDALEKANLQ